jgi:WD40 repeat protein
VSTEAAPQPPAIPDYELLRLIGRGAYGEVWLARGVTGVYRAVKLVWRDRFPEAGPYEREFHGLREFAAISLSESRQLALLHVGRDPAAAYFYYVMELADDVATGREIDPANYTPLTLKEMRARSGRLPAGECITLGVELARALSGLHARGLVHRDIKPSNVIIVGGAPKLADIGLVTEASAALTFVGTEGFVPPEGPGAPSADVFALGKLLYELLTGLDRHDYPRLPAELHAWPDRKEALELNEVLIRACEPHPDQRHTDAAALLEDLLLLQAGRSVRQLRRAERRVTRALRLGVLLALIATIAGLGAYLERQRANQEMAGRLAAEAERDALARRAVYAAALAQTQRALEQQNFGRARQLLREVAPAAGETDLRSFEWHALWREAQGDPARIIRTEGRGLNRIMLSPDGTLAAAHTDDRELTLFNISTGQEIRRISPILRLSGFSADSQWLLGCDSDLNLRRWRVADGVPAEPLAPGVNRPIGTTGDSRLLVFTDGASSAPHVLREWDLAGRTETWRFQLNAADGARADFFRAALSPDGRKVALGLVRGRDTAAYWELHVLEIGTGRVLFHEDKIDRITALAFDATSSHLAVSTSGESKTIALLDLADFRWRWRRSIGNSQSDVLAFAPDGRRLAAGGREAVLHLLACEDGRLLESRRGQASGLTALAWRPDGRSLFVGSTGGDIRLVDVTSPPPPSEVGGLWTPIVGRRLCLSPQGDRLVATKDGQNSLLFSTADLREPLLLQDMAAPVGFAPDGRLLGLTGEHRLAWFDPTTGRATALHEAPAWPGQTNALGTSSNLSRLALPTKEGTLVLGDPFAGKFTAVAQAHPTGVWWTAVSRDGRLALSGSEMQAGLWSAPAGESLGRGLFTVAPAVAGAIAPDNTWAAFGLRNGSIEVRRLPDFTLLRVIRTTSATIVDLVISGRGDRLYASGTNGTVHVITTDDWHEILALRVSPEATLGPTVDRLALSSDDNTLAAYTNDGRVRVWRH